MQQGARKFFPN